MKKAISFFYAALIVSFILPSGAIFNVPVKILLALALVFLLLFVRESLVFDKVSMAFAWSLLAVVLWSVISLFNGFLPTAISFLKSYFSLVFTVWVTYFLHKNGYVTTERVLKLVIAVAVLLVVGKIFLSLGMSFSLFTTEQILFLYEDIFSSSLTTMYVSVGNFTLYRMMVSNDSMPFVVYSFYLISEHKAWKKVALSLVMALYTFFIFSRVIILQFAAILAVAVLIFLRRLFKSRRDFLIAILLLFGCVLIALVVLFATNSEILNAILFRFKSDASTESDNIRNEQLAYLFEGFLRSPIFGYGTGSYVREYLRSEIIPFSYELEYVSFLYQFGLVGFCAIIGVFIYGAFHFCFSVNVPQEVWIMLLLSFAIWLVKPFFNPNFLSSNSGLILSVLYLYKEKFHFSNRLKERLRA